MKALENARRFSLQTQILVSGFGILSTSTLNGQSIKTLILNTTETPDLN